MQATSWQPLSDETSQTSFEDEKIKRERAKEKKRLPFFLQKQGTNVIRQRFQQRPPPPQHSCFCGVGSNPRLKR